MNFSTLIVLSILVGVVTLIIKRMIRSVEYFAGRKGLIPYRILYIIVAAVAPVLALDLVWTIADILNALMAIPNLVAVLLLSPIIAGETKKYINNLDAKDDTPIPVVKTGLGEK